MNRVDALSKAIDELLDEYEVIQKADLGSSDASLSPSGEQGESLTPNDQKGGLQPQGAQGAPAGGMGGDPTSIGAEVKVPVPPAPSQSGNGMGNDPVAATGGVAKAEEGGSAPPGFKGKDDEKSSGAEDEDAESEASGDEFEGDESGDESEGGFEGEQGESEGEGDEGEQGEEGQFGEQGEGDEDPKMEAAVEKALYKFMAKIGMTGEMGKSEDFDNLDPVMLEPRLAKSEQATDELRKSISDELAKRDAQIAELTALVKGLGDTLNKLSKAPVAKPRAVSGIQPLMKSEGEVNGGQALNKREIAAKAFEFMKTQSAQKYDRGLVAKIESAPSDEMAAAIARQAGVAV